MAKKSGFRGLVWLIVLVGLAAASYYGYGRFAQSKQKAIDYRTATIARGELVQSVTANGSISPVTNVTVGSQVSGIITDIKVDFNSKVTNGQVIAQIDPSTYQRMVTQARASLSNSVASLELAQVNYRRAKELFATKLISASDYDTSLANLHQAEANVQMSEANVEKNQVDLDRCVIVAPIDGVVIARAVEIGQTVASSFNTPTLFQIANDLRQMRIEAMVSEADVGGVQEGQEVSFTVEAYPNQQFNGTVSQVRYAAVTNQNVVNYSIIVSVNNSDLKLRPGMTANASIITARKTGVLRVPNGALRFRPPEGAIVLSNAAPALAGGKPTNGVASGDKGGGLGGGMGSMSPEERRKRFESMSSEEREAMRARFRQMAGGGGLPGGMGMGGGMGFGGMGARSDAPTVQTVYLAETDPTTKEVRLKPATVKTGITDGAFTEVLDGLKEGDVVVSGLNIALTSMPQTQNPFGGPFGRGPRR